MVIEREYGIREEIRARRLEDYRLRVQLIAGQLRSFGGDPRRT